MSNDSPSLNTNIEIFLKLFPNIASRINQLLMKFCHDLEFASEKKKDKTNNYSTPAVSALLTSFPHTYQSYTSCVDAFVKIGRNSPESAISVLLTILPNRPDNTLYNYMRSKIEGYASRANLYDLILILYFADCTAQILTVNSDTRYKDELLDLSYKMIEPFSESFEFPLRSSIVKQFSVIVSLISINNLKTIFDNFKTMSSKSDPSLFFILHRFVRLSMSKDVDHNCITDFLRTFNKMNPNGKEIGKYFPKYKKTKESKQQQIKIDISECWALSLNSLVTQLNVKDSSVFVEILEEIYKSALPKTTTKNPHPFHVMLCSNIVMRVQKNSKKNYQDFLKDVILKNKTDPKFLEQSLLGFLIIIRGHFCSRTTFFWEWGSFNANGKPGVEASHLFNPEEDQSLPSSFTNLFMNHFGNSGIHQYPKIVGDIFLNFAARDFAYFIQSTVPKLISTVGANNAIICLQECLQMIIDPNRQFAEWAQDNPRNSSIRIDMTIPLLFSPLKPHLFQTIESMVPKSKSSEAYCFKLTDSKEVPHFSLPFTTDSLPSDVKKRNGYSTVTVSKILDDWGIKEYQSKLIFPVESNFVQQVSDSEMKLLSLLEFVPRIINASDLGNSLGKILVTLVISDSKAISFFAIRVINQIFAAIEKARIVIFNTLNESILGLTNPVHVFMLMQLMYKLLDLSLEPGCQQKEISGLSNSFQQTIFYILTFPYPEIRDIAIMFIEKLTKFLAVYKLSNVFDKIFTTLDPTISAVSRYKIISNLPNKCNISRNYDNDHDIDDYDLTIPSTYITLREASLSRYHTIYNFFLIEVATAFSHSVSVQVLLNTIETLLSSIRSQPNDIDSDEFIHYANIFSALANLFPTLPPPNSPMSQYLENRLTPFYEFPTILGKIDQNLLETFGKHTKSFMNILQSVLGKVTVDPSNVQSNINIKLLRFLNAPIIANFMTYFNKWINDNLTPSNEKENSKNNKNDKDGKNADNDPSYSYLLVSTGIILQISKSLDMSFSLFAYEHSKAGFLTFIRRIEDYISDNSLANPDSKSYEQNSTRNDIKIVKNYLKIIQNFTNSLIVQTPPYNEGPIRKVDNDPWIVSGWPIESKRKTFNILVNISNFSRLSKEIKNSNKNKDIVKLGEMAKRSLGAFCRFSEIFDVKFELYSSLEAALVSLEQKNKYELYLPFILKNHRNLLYKSFATKMFSENTDISSHYFIAIAYLYYVHIDDSFSHKLGFNLTSNSLLAISNLKKMKPSRTVSRTFSDNSFSSFSSSLSEEEIRIHKELLQYSPKILVACILYLLHKDFHIRRVAFKLLQRVLPLIRTIVYPEQTSEVAKLVKELQENAPIFDSRLSTITPEAVQKVTSILQKSLNFMSDKIIKEVFHQIQYCRDGSFLSPMNSGLLLKFVSPLIRTQSLQNQESKKDWPIGFIEFTPLTLMSGLLHIARNINYRDLGFYLKIWESFASDQQTLEVVVNYLLDPEENDDCNDSIKMVLVSLSKNYSPMIVDSLVSRLSFAYWFKSSVEGKLDSKDSPKPLSPRKLDRVILTLTELVQPCFYLFLEKIPLIISFALIYYDQVNYHLADLLLILMAKVPYVSSSNLADVFIPPASLVWPSHRLMATNKNTRMKEFSPIDIALRSYQKEPMPVIDFIRSFKDLMIKGNMENIVVELGSELLRWVCGCGDLIVAGRAAFLFAEIMTPIDQFTIESIVQSLAIVCNCQQNEFTRFYIIGCFKIFSQCFEKFKKFDSSNDNENSDNDNQNNDDLEEQFGESFMLLFQIAAAFLGMPEDVKLCQSALAIATGFTIHSKCENCDIKKLLMRLSSLMATLKSKDTLYASFLAIFYRDKDNARSEIANIAVVTFLPIIYIALSAYHNIQPFTGEMSDSEIINVLRIMYLISETSFCPIPLQQQFKALFANPSSVEPGDFILEACSVYAQSKTAEKSTPFLCKAAAAASGTSEAFLSAVFAVVGGLLQSPYSTKSADMLANKFQSIARIAASFENSTQAMDLLQIYMQKITPSFEVPSIQSVLTATTTNNTNTTTNNMNTSEIDEAEDGNRRNSQGWDEMTRKLNECLQNINVIVPEGENDFVANMVIVPVGETLWNNEAVKGFREKMKQLKVCEKPFTKVEKIIKELRNIKVSPINLESIDLPKENCIYFSYLKELNIMI